MPDSTKDLVRRRLLGRGLRCAPIGDLARDLVLSRAAGGRLDFDFVAGVENLAQSLAVALTTPLGGDVFNAQFGFDGLNALAEQTSPILQRERIRVSIVALLRKDPRVSRIVDVRLADQRLEQPSTGARRQLEVRVAFEAVSGDQLTVNSGIAGLRLTDG
jgi:phage baseplate assembly protein W